MNSARFPYITIGEVVQGFGRGGKELGIPTANLSQLVVDELPVEYVCGIYYGLARIDEGDVYKMVMSIGYNPFFNNEKKSMEVHIIHKFASDFYGSQLRVCIVGWLRCERSFDSMNDLIAAIHEDIATAKSRLDEQALKQYLPYLDVKKQ